MLTQHFETSIQRRVLQLKQEGFQILIIAIVLTQKFFLEITFSNL
jgi:hypothetical protein